MMRPGERKHGFLPEATLVGRITVSLPDELEARLDELARQRGQSVSSLVARAVEALLESPAPPPPDEALAGRLEETRDYLSGLAAHVAQLRNSLVELGNWSPARPPYGWQFPPPAQHPPPPWRVQLSNEVPPEYGAGQEPV